MLNAELRVLDGKHQGKSIPLNVKKFLVGREADCQLRPNSDLVSRHHCVFTVDDYAVRLRDLGSTNGTLVNNERIAGQVVLQPGDIVSIGKLTFEFVVRAPDAASEEAPTGIVSEQDTLLPADSPLSEPEPVAQTPGDTTALQSVADVEAYQRQVAAFNQAAMAAAAAGQGMMPAGMQSGMFPGFMPQMPGYPGMMPGQMFPGQMMPQMMPGQMMPGYPGMMPGMMPQMMPMGYPGAMPTAPVGSQTVAMPPVAPPETTAKPQNKIKEMPVMLPPPEETGAAEPKPASAGGGKASPSISNAAADVIKQHMQRRPR